MKIGIDARRALQRRTGVENYILNLICALSKIESKHQFFLYTAQKDEAGLLPNKRNFHLISLNSKKPIWHFKVLAHIIRNNISVYHQVTPTAIIPSLIPNRCVVTIHDLDMFRNPHNYSWKEKTSKPILRFACGRVAKMIAVSKSTAEDINKILNCNTTKVSIIHEGIHPRYKPGSKSTAMNYLKRQYAFQNKTSQKYILHVGTIRARKNLVRLIQAFHKLIKKGFPYKLILVGKKSWGGERVFQEIRERDLEEDVKVVGYVPDEDLVYFYNAADVFIYPSLYEGFGLPPLEAMACSTPVIASRISSLPEVLGEAALYIKPKDVDDIVAKLQKVISDQKLREKLKAKGIERAGMFSWENAAQKTLEIYESFKNLTHL